MNHNIEQFSVCPIFESFSVENDLKSFNETGFFDKPLSDYKRERLEYILREYLSDNPLVTPPDFDVWEKVVTYALECIAPSVQKNTWLRYKATLQEVLNSALSKPLGPPVFIRNLLAKVVTAEVTAKPTEQTAKAVKVTKEEIYYMRQACRDELEALSLDWLEFNVLCNLRPNELQFAELHYPVDDAPFLTTKNTIKSEATKRAVAEGTMPTHRAITLNQLSMHELFFVENFLSLTHPMIQIQEYGKFYEILRKKLALLSNRCFSKTIALSVGRTQYAANQKALGLSAEKLAERMGHTDPTRPMRSYGRKTHGYARVKFKSADDIHDFDDE